MQILSRVFAAALVGREQEGKPGRESLQKTADAKTLVRIARLFFA